MNDHSPRKRFGQNFLRDNNIIHKIIDAVRPAATDHFVEIGPGQGAITEPLCLATGGLDVIEIDRDLATALRERDWPGEVRVHEADALRFDFAGLAADRPLRLVGNLPYNISTPLLFHLLDQASLFSDLHVMLQKEVVQRMAAGPGTKQYGRLSVMLAARCEVVPLFNISANCFYPPPRVESSFARLLPLPDPLVPDALYPRFRELVTAAFGMRRKTLANALRRHLSADEISGTGIDPGLRAEMLSPAEFLKLAELPVPHRD